VHKCWKYLGITLHSGYRYFNTSVVERWNCLLFIFVCRWWAELPVSWTFVFVFLILGASKEVSFRIWSPVWWEVVEADVVCIVSNIVESTFLRQICVSLRHFFIPSRVKFCELMSSCKVVMCESVGMIWRQFSKIRVMPLRFNNDQWQPYLFHNYDKCSSIMRISDTF
jgi:hypothetical protein